MAAAGPAAPQLWLACCLRSLWLWLLWLVTCGLASKLPSELASPAIWPAHPRPSTRQAFLTGQKSFRPLVGHHSCALW